MSVIDDCEIGAVGLGRGTMIEESTEDPTDKLKLGITV